MELPQRYDPKEVEPRLQAWWSKQKLLGYEAKSKKTVFSIDTPPLTMSGLLHMGHLIGYVPTDFIARFKRMTGSNVLYPMCFDSNGLPTERYVEKIRGIRGAEMSRDEFTKICLEEVAKGEAVFRKTLESLGMSYDWDQLYSTISPLGVRISQRSFIDLHKQGRVYRQEGPVTWCPSCRTAIAQAELEDQKRSSQLNTLAFKLKGSKEGIHIATSRPEFLAACVAIFVHPDDSRYKKFIGSKANVPIFGQEVPILADSTVDKEFGTGAVMVCTFGDRTDIAWVQKHKLPLRIILDRAGKLTGAAGKFAGLKADEARKQIVEELKKEGSLLKSEPLEQTVNAHDKCGTPVEFLITSQWYVRILDMKEKWKELGAKVKWVPEHMQVRYQQWVEGLNSDWCISRQRYFGVQVPVWYCKKCNEVVLADESQLPVNPTKAKPKNKCKCGSDEFIPDTDVMDTWTTSALTPLLNARWGEKDSRMDIVPMSMRPQGHDIIRTWAFYTIAKTWMHVKSTPWKTLMINGHGLDPHGRKMSKSKGNVVEPQPVIEKYSADAIRYWTATAKLGYDVSYMEKDIARGQMLLNKLWNASRFISTASGGFDGKKPKQLKPMDVWLLSKLNRVVKKATDDFNAYQYSDARTGAEDFFWHSFCDNYLEAVKYRLYDSKDASAQWTLNTALLTLLKMFAPVLPHITEELYQKMFGQEKATSIHASAWPEADGKLIDDKTERAGDDAVAVMTAVRAWKHDNKMPLNAPLKGITIEAGKDEKNAIEAFLPDIAGATKATKVTFGPGKLEVPGTKLKFTAV